jgi:hypothetical protein
MLPCQHFEAAFVDKRYQLFQNEKQVTFDQSHRNCGAHSGENTEVGCVRDGMFPALLLLLALPLGIVCDLLRTLLWMMHRAA